MTRRAVIAILVAVFLLRVNCRKADGAREDPINVEAEAAFLGYLQIDTSNPPGNETKGAEYLRQLLVKEGIEARMVGADPNRQALYARLRSNGTEKALLLLSHIDVVPADASQWTHPPFAATRAGGYIWGRGALDIKSLTIAQAMSMIDLKRRKAKLRRDVILLAVPDEELGGQQGAAALLESSPDLFDDVGFVLNEGGSNETVVDKVVVWGIEVQQKVPLWLRVTTETAGGHAASPPERGGAISSLVRALTAIEAIRPAYRLSPPVREVLAEARRLRKDPGARKLDAITEPLDPARIDRDLPPGWRNLLRDTLAITRISGGTATNVIPSRATAEIDIRLLPDSTPVSMLTQIRQAVGEEAEVEVVLSGQPSPASPRDGELYRVVAAALQKAEKGSVVVPAVGLGTTDSRFFRARGIPSYGVAPFKVNYYDVEGVHGVDERIRARFFTEGVRVMRTIVHDFCARR